MATNLSISGKLTVGGGVNLTSLTASRVLVTDSSKNIISSAITSTELGYLDGASSNIQTQLNGKAASSHTHSGTQVTGLTASRALVSNSSGQVAVSAVTSTELGYLDGVTRNIQDQLNNKSGGVGTSTEDYTTSGTSYGLDSNNKSRGSTSIVGTPNSEVFNLDTDSSTTNNLAGYNYSHAEGFKTVAAAGSSHAEGNQTATIGANSLGAHAEGYGCVAGSLTISGGIYGAHAEGCYTQSSHVGTHAEGFDTISSQPYSHAEGYKTKANSQASHAEGYQTTASGMYSHAEGDSSQASGQASHAEGRQTKASGYWSHAEGYQTTASKYGSHAEGWNTIASGDYSHAEGQNTTASGMYSHAEGLNTIASGMYSHAEGLNTIASSQYQHVQGAYNIEDTAGKYVHIVGWGTSSSARKNIHTIDTSGNAVFSGTCTATSHPTSSSRRFKENFREVSNEEINKILELNATKYDLKEEYGGTKDRVGYIAEDIESIFPNCVSYDADNNICGIDYSSFVPYMIEIMKKQEERIKVLESKNS